MRGSRTWMFLLVAGALYLTLAAATLASPRSTPLSALWSWLPLGRTAPMASLIAHTASLICLLALYTLQVRWSRDEALPARLIFGVAVVHGAALLFAPGVLSGEVLNDMGYGRVLAHYGANPFATPASTFPPDAITGAMARAGSPPASGPVWITLASLLALAGGGAFVPTLLLFRAVAFAAHLINGALILGIAARWRAEPGRLRPDQSLLIYLWNPLLLSQSTIEGRHEVLALTALLACVWLLQRGDRVLGATSIAMALLMDYVMAPAAGLMLSQRARRGWRDLAIVAGIGLAVAAIAFAPYLGGVGREHFAPPYWIPPEPASLLVALEIVLAAASGSATAPWMPRFAMAAWVALAALLTVLWGRGAVRSRRLEDVVEESGTFFALLLVTGAAAFQIPAVGWVVALAGLSASARLRQASSWLVLGAIGIEALGFHRLLLGEGASPMPGARLVVSLVAGFLPGLYLLLHIRGKGRHSAPPEPEGVL